MKRLSGNKEKASEIEVGFKNGSLGSVLSGRHGKAVDYIYKLTRSLITIQKEMVEELKLDFDKRKILEINQVVSWFCFVNRAGPWTGRRDGGSSSGIVSFRGR